MARKEVTMKVWEAVRLLPLTESQKFVCRKVFDHSEEHTLKNWEILINKTLK